MSHLFFLDILKLLSLKKVIFIIYFFNQVFVDYIFLLRLRMVSACGRIRIRITPHPHSGPCFLQVKIRFEFAYRIYTHVISCHPIIDNNGVTITTRQ